MSYDIVLWLYPHKYGLRIKDGQWIRKNISNKKYMTIRCGLKNEIITEYHYDNEIIYTTDTKEIYKVNIDGTIERIK